MRKQITKTYEAREIYSPYGTIEFLDIGEGTPVLVSHGTMGGWDHGFMMAERLLGMGYRLIVPSRFGYLRSSMPDSSDFETQADCFAYLLDVLNVHETAVLGLSAGGVPAMTFSLKYAERVAGLILVSTALRQASNDSKQTLPASEKAYQWVLKSDFRFRILLRFFPGVVRNLLGATKKNVALLVPEEYDFMKIFANAFLPVSKRYAGWLNDSSNLKLPEALPLESIKSPTLIIGAEDDYLAPHDWSRLVADKIPGAKLITHSTGGHLLLGHTKAHRQKLRNFIDASRMEAMLDNHRANVQCRIFPTLI